MVYDSYPILVTMMFPLLSHINPYYPISIHSSSHYGIAETLIFSSWERFLRGHTPGARKFHERKFGRSHAKTGEMELFDPQKPS